MIEIVKDKVELAFCTPPFANVQASAGAGLALAANPTGMNAFYNQCVFVGCTTRFLDGYSAFQAYIPCGSLFAFSEIEVYFSRVKFIKNQVRDIILDMLSQGYYVFFNGVDDYFLDGKSFYQTRHFNHDGIICGYDLENETYSVAAYDENWLFSLIKIPIKSFEMGMEYALSVGAPTSIAAFRAKDNEIKLNVSGIRNKLELYLDEDMKNHIIDGSKKIEGILAHDYLAKYLDMLADGSISHEKMDWRAMRPFWEHKRCMRERLAAVEAAEGRDSLVSEKYREIVDVAQSLRMSYAYYHRRKRDGLLSSMKEKLLYMRDKERELIEEFLNVV